MKLHVWVWLQDSAQYCKPKAHIEIPLVIIGDKLEHNT
jgi:hypothetical protein